MTVQLWLGLPAAAVAIVTLVQGLRVLSPPFRLREVIAKDVAIRDALKDGPTRSAVDRSIIERTQSLILMEQRRPSVTEWVLLGLSLLLTAPYASWFALNAYESYLGVPLTTQPADDEAVQRVAAIMGFPCWVAAQVLARRRNKRTKRLKAAMRADFYEDCLGVRPTMPPADGEAGQRAAMLLGIACWGLTQVVAWRRQ